MNTNHASDFTFRSHDPYLLHDAARLAAPRLRQRAIAEFWADAAALLRRAWSPRRRTAPASARGVCAA